MMASTVAAMVNSTTPEGVTNAGVTSDSSDFTTMDNTTALPLNVTSANVNATTSNTTDLFNVTAINSTLDYNATNITNVTTTTLSGNAEEAVNATPILLATFLALIIFINLALNIFVIIVFARSKKFCVPGNYFYVALAVVDVSSAGLWTALTLIAAINGQWNLGDTLCHIQGYASTLFFLLNMHFFLVIMGERLLKLISPSRHQQTFLVVVTFIIIVSVLAFDSVVTVFPLIGWNVLQYHIFQYQCFVGFDNFTHMNFFYIVGYGVPILIGLILLVVLVVKRKRIKRKGNKTKGENQSGDQKGSRDGKDSRHVISTSGGDSYGDKFRKQQFRFKNIPVRKLRRKRSGSDDGYSSDSSLEKVEQEFMSPYMRKLEAKKTAYKMELNLTVLVFLAWGIYILLWAPFIALNYIYIISLTENVFATGIPDFAWTVAMVISHCGTFIKPLCLILSMKFRKAIKEAFTRKRPEEQSSKKAYKVKNKRDKRESHQNSKKSHRDSDGSDSSAGSSFKESQKNSERPSEHKK